MPQTVVGSDAGTPAQIYFRSLEEQICDNLLAAVHRHRTVFLAVGSFHTVHGRAFFFPSNGQPCIHQLFNSPQRSRSHKATGMIFAGGWKQIDGRWYYFCADGAMAVNTTGYIIGLDGVRK